MAWFLVNSDDLRRLEGRGVDPGYGVNIGRPPVDPGYGQPAPPMVPGYPLPSPPVHPWLPGYGGGPGIDNSLPGGGWSGNYPSQGLPGFPPHISNELPGGPPAHPWLPSWLAGLIGGPRPDQGLPGGRPPHPWRPGHIPGLPEVEPPEPTEPPTGPVAGYILVFVPGYGYKVVQIPIESLPPPAEPK